MFPLHEVGRQSPERRLLQHSGQILGLTESLGRNIPCPCKGIKKLFSKKKTKNQQQDEPSLTAITTVTSLIFESAS